MAVTHLTLRAPMNPGDRQPPMLRRDVGDRAVIADVERIDRGDVAASQHGRRWLSVIRQASTHNHVGALAP